MKSFLVIFNIFVALLKADIANKHDKWRSSITAFSYNGDYPKECAEILESFAQYASDLSFCSIRNSRPIRLCEKCIDQYVKFHDKYQELVTTVENGTSCGSIFMSQDRLNVVMDYYNSIEAVWKKGNCNKCYMWDGGTPKLKNETITFNKMYYDTMLCISTHINAHDEKNVCEDCFDKYDQLDNFYKTLSSDAIGVDSVCMDIVDSMNATRSIWSKNLDCCRLRRKPEIAFLCCASIMSILPLIYYLAVRFYGPIRDLPNVLKQSRFKQSLLRSTYDTIN